MDNDRSRSKSGPISAPPEVSGIDASWDDDTAPNLDLDDPLNEFDRVTAVPDLPAELYAKKVMESVDDGRVPDLSSEPPTISVRRIEPAPFALDTAPPNPERDPDSTARRPALSPHSAPTARPMGNPRRAEVTLPLYSPSPTGLELEDLSLDSVSTLEAAPVAAPSQSRDPRDPVLELELDGLASGPPGARPEAAEDPATTEMKDRYAMGDFTGALVIAEGILEANPEDLDAPRYAQSCRDVLTQMYSARLGSLDQVARITVPSDQIRWLTLDHRAGFLLSLIDGGSTVDQILDISGMTRLDALRIMYQLLDQRVISLGS